MTSGFSGALVPFRITQKSKISAFGTSITSDFSTISQFEKEFDINKIIEYPLYIYEEEEDRDTISIKLCLKKF